MLKRNILPILALASLSGLSRDINVTEFTYCGPIEIVRPLAAGDTAKIPMPELMDISFAPNMDNATVVTIEGCAPTSEDADALNTLQFYCENRNYAKATLNVTGLKNWSASCDGKKVNGELKLTPGTHPIQIKYATKHGEACDSLKVTLTTDNDELATFPCGGKIFTLEDVLCGVRVTGTSISPSGTYVLVGYRDTDATEKSTSSQAIYDIKAGKFVGRTPSWATWMPNSDRYYFTRESSTYGIELVVINPADGSETVLANNIPAGSFVISPDESYLLYSLVREGKKENPKAYQVLEPEDRQPGWRNRAYPAIYRLNEASALMPLAYGVDNVWINDISRDGNKVLLSTSKSRLERRPTTVSSIIALNLYTMQADTILKDEDFIGSAQFSPKGDKIVVMGTPEAFNRIGCILPDSVTPSMIQQELFVIDLATKDIKPITKDFPFNPQDMAWNPYDEKIYTRAEKRDQYAIYRIDPKTCEYQEIVLPECIVKGYDLSQKAPLMSWWGQGDSNPDKVYITDLKKKSNTIIDQPSASRLKDVKLAKCTDWNFVNSKGDTIYGRFYVPDNFDPNEKYPLIVNYYGGCSPSQRYFESRYPWHVYAQQGYVAYIIQPSGATGFGQEFSSRHVNTAGDGPAQDIIEGTLKFVEEHPFVNADKIGCIGASYGGFMTQYLQTITDIFAAAVSHAGISDHTSYWGEGWWGYSYSEVSMANSYPWSETDLYVKQSPLYNADKVNTPLLFLHGDGDINVPVGESIQMFTALKLLGRPTAFVAIEGENHHISNYEKRRLWQNSIFAWFAKYLKDDPSWWNDMYPAEKEF